MVVDAGANDPVLDSQSQHLDALGRANVLIEPAPDSHELAVFQVSVFQNGIPCWCRLNATSSCGKDPGR